LGGVGGHPPPQHEAVRPFEALGQNRTAGRHPSQHTSAVVRPRAYVRAVERIAVIGCGGAGKTMLSRRLGRLLDMPVVHIDAHYWRDVGGRRIESTPEQWAERHRVLVAGKRWVIDGMKLGVLPDR